VCQIPLPLGAVDCWVYISCLEVLQRIESFCDTNQNDMFAVYAAGLRAYAREKVCACGSLFLFLNAVFKRSKMCVLYDVDVISLGCSSMVWEICAA